LPFIFRSFFLNLWLRPFATRIVVVFVVVKHEYQNWRVFSFFFYFGSEKWEKVNFTWHPNGTVSYQPTKTFFFNREMSYGDESDLVQTLNIPLVVSFYPY
jgi:hypothetical protein